jgi:hypothetical protein
MLQQIGAIKAGERVRACIAEAAYQTHLDNLKHKECLQEDEGYRCFLHRQDTG